jgi:hypothetical protein
MISENKTDCDLCSLPVEVQGFTLKTTEGDKTFCCEGCKGIYEMLHEELILPQSADSEIS